MAVFYAVVSLYKHFSVHVKKHCFLILYGMMLTHALWNETFLYSEVSSSFLVNTVQTVSKSVYNCQSYWQKFRGTVYKKVVLSQENRTMPRVIYHIGLHIWEATTSATRIKIDACCHRQNFCHQNVLFSDVEITLMLMAVSSLGVYNQNKVGENGRFSTSIHDVSQTVSNTSTVTINHQ